MSLIECVLKNDALRQQIEATNPTAGVAIWWLGQSGFLVKGGTGTVLFDPYLSDSLTHKYATTDKPHVRMTELSIAPEQLMDIDVVTSTHNHTDHLDADTLKPLIAANPDMSLIIPEANREFVAKRLECDPSLPIGFSDGELKAIPTSLSEIEVIAVPAAHNEVDRDDGGRCKYLGYVARMGDVTVYHSGDTMLYDGMAEGLKPFNIDVAFLPINGFKPERRVSGNLFGDEAARLAHEIGAGVVIPCHYDMFTFNTESPELFVRTCEKLNQPHKVLKSGERMEFPGS